MPLSRSGSSGSGAGPSTPQARPASPATRPPADPSKTVQFVVDLDAPAFQSTASNDSSSLDTADAPLNDDNSFFGPLLSCVAPLVQHMNKMLAKPIIAAKRRPWEVSLSEIVEHRWLGAGSQGAVFLGEYKGEMVAVKKLRECSPQTLRELKTLYRLSHPNIIGFRGVTQPCPVVCLVMEYAEGGNLYEKIRSGNEELGPRVVANWAMQIASAMEYLHSQEIIHRDLKSPNILIGGDDQLKLSDFGASRERSDKSTQMTFAGTVSWMAPEMIRNERCSDRVDVYSFGVVLWELLTGSTPYQGMEQSAIIWGVGSGALSLPIPNTAPDGFKLLLEQCWAPKAQNRPSFSHILSHLNIAAPLLVSALHDSFLRSKLAWREEIGVRLADMKARDVELKARDESLIRKREDELRVVQQARAAVEATLREATERARELEARAAELEARERHLKVREDSLSRLTPVRPLVVKSRIQAAAARLERDHSLEDLHRKAVAQHQLRTEASFDSGFAGETPPLNVVDLNDDAFDEEEEEEEEESGDVVYGISMKRLAGGRRVNSVSESSATVTESLRRHHSHTSTAPCSSTTTTTTTTTTTSTTPCSVATTSPVGAFAVPSSPVRASSAASLHQRAGKVVLRNASRSSSQMYL